MSKMRQVLVIICIAVMILTATTTVASDLLVGIIVPLGPLFGTLISVPVAQADAVQLAPSAFFSVRTSRSPPLA